MKKILLLILMLIMTGCSAKYELKIEDNVISEKLILESTENDYLTKEELYGQFLDEYPIYYDEEFLYYAPTQKQDGIEYYEKTLLETQNGYESVHKSKMDFKNYKRSRMLNTAFKNFNIGYDKKEQCYYIIAQDLKLFDYNKSINELEVVVNLNGYEIIDTNSNKYVGNSLTWYFYPNDNITEKIIIKFRKKKDIIEKEEIKNENLVKQEEENNIFLLLISFGAFLIIILGIIITNQKRKKTWK